MGRSRRHDGQRAANRRKFDAILFELAMDLEKFYEGSHFQRKRTEPPFDAPFGDVILEMHQDGVDGYDLDLLPDKKSERSTEKECHRRKRQVRNALDKIRDRPTYAMTKDAAGLPRHSLFVRLLVKLCKYWEISNNVSLSGGSTTLEIIAVQIAEREVVNKTVVKKTAPSLRVALTYFFQQMQTRGVGAATSALARMNQLNREAYERALQLSDIKTIFESVEEKRHTSGK